MNPPRLFGGTRGEVDQSLLVHLKSKCDVVRVRRFLFCRTWAGELEQAQVWLQRTCFSTQRLSGETALMPASV